MDFLNNFSIPGATDFLGGLLADVIVTKYSDDEIRLQFNDVPNVAVVIEGDDFTYQNGMLSGGEFGSLEVLMVDQGGDENLLLEVEVNGDEYASINDILSGNVGVELEIGDALTDLLDDGALANYAWVADLLDNVLEGDDGDDDISGDDRDNDINGDGGDDDLAGGKGDDDLNGGKGDDELRGNSGKDDLDGGKGDDDLFGGSGNDVVSGGRGDDALWGNKGRDSFVFGRNFDTDRIKDFKDNVDTIVLDDNLWKGNMSIGKMLDKFGEVTNNGVVLDFGGGDILKIAGVDSLSDLRNDIDII